MIESVRSSHVKTQAPLNASVKVLIFSKTFQAFSFFLFFFFFLIIPPQPPHLGRPSLFLLFIYFYLFFEKTKERKKQNNHNKWGKGITGENERKIIIEYLSTVCK